MKVKTLVSLKPATDINANLNKFFYGQVFKHRGCIFRTMLHSLIEVGFLEANQEVKKSQKKYEIKRTLSLR